MRVRPLVLPHIDIFRDRLAKCNPGLLDALERGSL